MSARKPLAGYRRLSVDRDKNTVGYDTQTDGAEKWAEDHGYTIGEWYEDKDKSAANEKVIRPEFQRMLADIRLGLYGGIIVYRADRLARMRWEWEETLRVVRAAGGIIVSASENQTTETDFGDTILAFQVGMGDHEVRTMKRRIKANSTTRAKLGRYSGGGRRPFGFEAPEWKLVNVGDDEQEMRLQNSGRIGIEHVPEEVELLQDAARRIAWESESYTDVINDWHSRTPPVYGATGAPWNPKTLETILTSHRMIGKRLVGGVAYSAGWQAVLDEDTWRRLTVKTRVGLAKSPRQKYLLSGRIFCECGRPMSGATRKYKKGGENVPTRTYRCKSGPADKARGSCGSCNVIAEPTEDFVVARVLARVEMTRGLIESTSGDGGDGLREIEALDRAIDDDTEFLQDLAVRFGRKEFGASEWMAIRTEVAARVADAQKRQEALKSALPIRWPAGEEWRNLPAWWMALSFAQQLQIVSRTVGKVLVSKPGRSGRYFNESRLEVVPPDAEKAS